MPETRWSISRVIRLTAGFAISLLFVLPLYWAGVASVRESGAPPPASIAWWEPDPHWENFASVFELVPMLKYMTNSLLVVAVAVPVTLLVSSLAGFAVSQLAAHTRDWVVNLSVAMLLIPSAAVWLFRFQLLVWFGLLDTLWALIVPAFAASSPLFVLLFNWNYRRVPADTFDAARMDGAGAWTTWWRVALPLSRPTILGVTVLTFLLYWSDFISPVLYIYNPDHYTMPVGLQLLNQVGSTNWPVLMAGALIMTAPVFVLFLLLQRFFLHDLTLAGLFDRN
ncbi:MAG TPA: carbohydrate ABC transporter permease [Anaerolineales bacterium]|nr:carbohydrate ABC transporter permease [Anaerolineales bacterium]